MADLSQSTIRVGAAVAVSLAILSAGMWIGGRSRDVDSLVQAQAETARALQASLSRVEAKIDTLYSNITLLQTDVARLKAAKEAADAEHARLDRETRLLKDFVEGRIGNRPYREHK